MGEAGAVVKTFHAYLESAGSDALSIAYDDETDGIHNVNRNESESSKCYTLSGQQVKQPTRGLYIVNGKKVLVK